MVCRVTLYRKALSFGRGALHAAIAALTVGISAVAAPAAPGAAPSPSTARVAPTPATSATGVTAILRWADEFGQNHPAPVVMLEWAWARRPSESFESPVLRVAAASGLLAGWSIRAMSENAAESGATFYSDPGIIQVDLRTFKSTMRFEFADRLGRSRMMNLFVVVLEAKPQAVVHSLCARHGIGMHELWANARHLLVGLSCTDRGDHVVLRAFRSQDATWNDGVVKSNLAENGESFSFEVDKPQVPESGTRMLLEMSTRDPKQATAEYRITYQPPPHDLGAPSPRVLGLSVGLGASGYQYSEGNGRIQFSQASLTGKATFGITLVRNLLDVGLNGYSTLTTLAAPSNGLPAARFYGLNGRIGYRLPVGLGALEYRFLTGWYFWGMSVPSGDDGVVPYGMGSISGPQLFFMVSRRQAMHRSWFLYAKWALISDGFADFARQDNRELAIGGGFELTRASQTPLSITLDAAHAQYSNEMSGMSLGSVTLGLQKAF